MAAGVPASSVRMEMLIAPVVRFAAMKTGNMFKLMAAKICDIGLFKLRRSECTTGWKGTESFASGRQIFFPAHFENQNNVFPGSISKVYRKIGRKKEDRMSSIPRKVKHTRRTQAMPRKKKVRT